MTEPDDPAIAADMLLGVHIIARRLDDPTADGRGAVFERLVVLRQPALLQADR